MGVTEEMNSAEIMKNAMDAFKDLQEYMLPYRKTSRIKLHKNFVMDRRVSMQRCIIWIKYRSGIHVAQY